LGHQAGREGIEHALSTTEVAASTSATATIRGHLGPLMRASR